MIGKDEIKMEEKMTVQEALERVVHRLNNINVPVGLLKTIGVDIAMAVDDLNTIRQAIQDQNKEEEHVVQDSEAGTAD